MRSSRSGKWMLGALISLLLFNADAAPPKLLGLDDMSCAAWLGTKSDTDQRPPYLAWARGFLSGHNYANQSQQVTDLSSGTVELYIERFCRDKPTARFIDAPYRMSDQYSGRDAPISK